MILVQHSPDECNVTAANLEPPRRGQCSHQGDALSIRPYQRAQATPQEGRSAQVWGAESEGKYSWAPGPSQSKELRT